MIRILAAAGLTLMALMSPGLAGSAAAQTWGQPVYVTPYGAAVGGTPLSEVETRSYRHTGRHANGYAGEVYVHAPAQVHGSRHGYSPDRRYGPDHDRYGYGQGRDGRRPRQGYRDEWGYDDDRHPSARSGRRDRQARYPDRDCGCGDVYLYDR